MNHEFRMKQIEVQNRNPNAGNAQEENPNNNGNGHRAAGMKALKLPPFNDEKMTLMRI